MAYYFLFPEKDTTIYSHPYRTDLNTGKVETLSLTSEVGNDDNKYYPSRFLIKFNQNEIDNVIINKISNSLNSESDVYNAFSSSLKLYATEFNGDLPKTQTIEARALWRTNEDFENGTGRYNNHPYFNGIISDGASWLYADNGTNKTPWVIPAPDNSSYTGSYIDTAGGGSWWINDIFEALSAEAGMEPNQTINITDNFDLNLDVGLIVKKFYTNSQLGSTESSTPPGIENYGFIIKRKDDTININDNQGTLKYFSGDTHTIFSPTLIFKWDDSNYSPPKTTYVSTLTSGKIQLNPTNLKQEYKQSEEPIIRIHARPQYPDREFTTSSLYTKPYYLNATSYYSIEDYTSKEVIIPFDTEFTKLSANIEGMYFKLYIQGLQPERYYRLLIRHDNNDGINIYDEDWYFKVVR